jgi:prepilin-type N-terminal cleavage/methylation domain-containing protein
MIQHLTNKKNDEGFTLIELLVVIVILGILAAVVVFAVGGITDKGQNDSCKTDTRTIRTAEEANFAKNGGYVAEDVLVTNKFLAQESTLHGITVTGTGSTATYVVTVADAKCGSTASANSGNVVDAAHPANL